MASHQPRGGGRPCGLAREKTPFLARGQIISKPPWRGPSFMAMRLAQT